MQGFEPGNLDVLVTKTTVHTRMDDPCFLLAGYFEVYVLLREIASSFQCRPNSTPESLAAARVGETPPAGTPPLLSTVVLLLLVPDPFCGAGVRLGSSVNASNEPPPAYPYVLATVRATVGVCDGVAAS